MTARACPLCATVSPDVFCPRCRSVKILVKTKTAGELRHQLNTMKHSAGLIKKALDALEGVGV